MSNYSIYRINYALRSHKRDAFIEFIKSQLMAPFALHVRPLSSDSIQGFLVDNQPAGERSALEDAKEMRDRYADIFYSIERLIGDHQGEQDKRKPESRLQMLVPTIGKFFSPLPLRDAFLEHDDLYALSARRHIPLSFNEIRCILNTAQVKSTAPKIELITFFLGELNVDDDGADFDENSHLVNLLVELLKFRSVHVAIVTAAGYSEAERYEKRLSGLLKGFAAKKVSLDAVSNFWVMGGECNYLFRCQANYRLERVPLPFLPEAFFSYMFQRGTLQASGLGSQDLFKCDAIDNSYPEEHVTGFLDVGQRILELCQKQMRLPAKVIRKPRAVGIIPEDLSARKLTREQLDECVLSLQHGLNLYLRRVGEKDTIPLPFCAFNGGNDVWVDIGNKLIGVRILQEYIGVTSESTLHVGDQFLSTGNDYAARRGCSTLWITNPDETANALSELIGAMRKAGRKAAS